MLFWLYYWNALILSNDTPTSDIRGKLNAALLTFLIMLLKDLRLHKRNTKKKQKRAFVVFLTSVVLYLTKPTNHDSDSNNSDVFEEPHSAFFLARIKRFRKLVCDFSPR